MAEKRTYNLHIMNEDIKISTDTDPKRLRQLISLVEQKASEIQLSTKLVSNHKIALLTLILLANEITSMKEELNKKPKEEEDIEKRLLNLIEQLDSSMSFSEAR